MDSANSSGQQLVAEVLDDPSVTQQDMRDMNEMWENVCQKSVQKQERLDDALEVHVCFSYINPFSVGYLMGMPISSLINTRGINQPVYSCNTVYVLCMNPGCPGL